MKLESEYAGLMQTQAFDCVKGWNYLLVNFKVSCGNVEFVCNYTAFEAANFVDQDAHHESSRSSSFSISSRIMLRSRVGRVSQIFVSSADKTNIMLNDVKILSLMYSRNNSEPRRGLFTLVLSN